MAKKTAKKAVKKTAKKATKKVAKKAAKKATKKAVKKTAKKVAKKATAKKASPKKVAITPTLEEIEITAYYIYINRKNNKLPGNSQSDWHQAIVNLSK